MFVMLIPATAKQATRLKETLLLNPFHPMVIGRASKNVIAIDCKMCNVVTPRGKNTFQAAAQSIKTMATI